ncbi:ACP S-malonyltransferase [Geobacter argillaceus]|uniref:[acyl-carrier-protein] S-malonyltransferase n=1 Tax=Geobacter argillaceus TaxID=345631 RepID=A0A562VM09_9BACT|nr:acyltransferase domain-containing protein [Geobacter argillaceus]TWJ19003.1 malonyl CoA-acyl carrier protein transacylase [Geobacter argillaceus]
MICFMFPGQPLSLDGTVPVDADFAEIARLTFDRTGLDLGSFSWSGVPATEHVALQVYGTAMSLYRYRSLHQQGQKPAIIAEHSMGIYAAMAASGAVAEGDALELVWRIGSCMAGMGQGREYALGCATGLTRAPLLAIAENCGVYLANQNTSRHFLLAGDRHAIECAMAEALSAGAFSARTVPCDAPLHTPLLEEISDALRDIVRDYRFVEPTLPLMSHIDQDFLTAADLPEFLVRELCLPVDWEKTYLALRRAGVTQFVEVGAGDALRKYNRWIASELG